MKLKRVLTSALAVCLTIGCCSFASAAANPEVTVEVAVIKSSKTIEIGLNVDAVTDFKSAGAVLEIDSSKLEFIDWKNAVPTPDMDQAITVNTNKAAAWDTFTTIPSKGSDAAAAKPAIAYQDKTSKKNYLYLGADSFSSANVEGRLVTVRLRLVGENAWDTLFPAEPVDANAWKTTLASYVKLAAKENGINISPAAVQVTVMNAQNEKTVYEHGAYRDNVTDNVNVSIVAADNVPSQFGGSGGGDTYAVTLLDWDGSILTTAALSQTSFADELKALMEEKDSTLNTALTGKTGYDFDEWLDYSKAETLIDADKMVTANNDPLKTVAVGNADVLATIVDTAKIGDAIPEGATGITLMASYKGNAALDKVGSATSNYLENEGARTYLRYGFASANNGKYSIGITAERKAVERIKRVGVIVQMSTTGDAKDAVYSLLRPTNSEQISFELVPTREIKYVAYTVVDLYNVSSWPNAASRSGAFQAIDMNTAIQEGTINFILQQAALEKAGAASDWGSVDSQAFIDAKGGGSFPEDQVDGLKTTLLGTDNLDKTKLLAAIDAVMQPAA